MIASLDGGATDDGKAGGLAGPGDRALFGLMRQQADVILVGAGTVRIENYSGAQFSPAQRQARQRRGQAEVPPIAVVTNSGEFDHDAKLFTRTEVPPLILTSPQAVADTHGRLGSVGRGDRRVGPASRPGRRRDRSEDPGRPQAVPRAHRGWADASQHADRGRPARRVVPDDRAASGRRHGADASPPAPAKCTPRCGAATCSPTTRATCTRATSGATSRAISTVVRMRRRRLVRALSTSTVVLSALLAGCAPLLAADPRYATDSGARPQGQPTDEKKADGPPAIEAPKNDLSWRNCTSQVFSDSAVQPLPGVTLDCATYDADLDSINGATGSVSIGVVRARSVQTPEDAGPLVMTTGSDLPSSVQLPVWLSRAGADVLKSTSDRGRRPARHGNVGLDRLPRPVRPSGNARPGAVPVRRRPGRQPRRGHHDGHHQLHRHHRARRLGLRQFTRRRGHRAAAQHLGCADHRAAGHRQRGTGGAGLCRLASRQGGAAGARLAVAARHRRRGRHRTARQG